MTKLPNADQQAMLQDMRDGLFNERIADSSVLSSCSRAGWCYVGYDGDFQLSNSGYALTSEPHPYFSRAYETASRRVLL